MRTHDTSSIYALWVDTLQTYPNHHLPLRFKTRAPYAHALLHCDVGRQLRRLLRTWLSPCCIVGISWVDAHLKHIYLLWHPMEPWSVECLLDYSFTLTEGAMVFPLFVARGPQWRATATSPSPYYPRTHPCTHPTASPPVLQSPSRDHRDHPSTTIHHRTRLKPARLLSLRLDLPNPLPHTHLRHPKLSSSLPLRSPSSPPLPHRKLVQTHPRRQILHPYPRGRLDLRVRWWCVWERTWYGRR